MYSLIKKGPENLQVIYLKKEKELLNNRLKNYEQIIAMRKKKKPISNSMMIYKPNNSSNIMRKC